jgi:hypothetical protein
MNRDSVNWNALQRKMVPMKLTHDYKPCAMAVHAEKDASYHINTRTNSHQTWIQGLRTRMMTGTLNQNHMALVINGGVPISNYRRYQGPLHIFPAPCLAQFPAEQTLTPSLQCGNNITAEKAEPGKINNNTPLQD